MWIVAILALLAQAQRAGPAAPQSVQDWMSIMPEVNNALDAAFPGERVRGQYPPAILHVADVIGDGASVAFVSFGLGGASTDQLALLRIRNGKPVVTRFKDRTGKILAKVFVEGASVTHTDSVELLARQHAVLALHYNYSSDGKLHECGVDAYKWNPADQTFDFNPGISRKLGTQKCSEVPKKVG